MALALEGPLREIDRSVRRPEWRLHCHGDALRSSVIGCFLLVSQNFEKHIEIVGEESE